MELDMQFERWSCNYCCAEGSPCVVEITSSNNKLPEHLKGRDRFENHVCLCNNSRITEWKKVISVKGEG